MAGGEENDFDVKGEAVYDDAVRDEWIDINDHMNVAYYVLAFDYGIDGLWQRIGIDDAHVRDSRGSTFAVESHIEYRREMRLGQRFVVTTQLLAYDSKRLHQYLRMYRLDDGALAATSEWMNLYVNLNTRRVAEWPADILGNLERFASEQRFLAPPERAGRQMRVRSPLYSVMDSGNRGPA